MEAAHSVPSGPVHGIAVPTAHERSVSLLTHLGTLSVLIGIPLGNILCPLIILLIKGKESGFIRMHCNEALNFQITMTLATLLLTLVCGGMVLIGFFLLGPFIIPIAGILVIGIGAIAILQIVLTIMASVEANAGRLYQYPLTIRFLR